VQTAFEVGDASSEAPWEFTADNGRDQEALDDYQKYASLHMRLYPYEWSYAQQIATTGRPIERPFGLAFPQVGQHPSDEYLFGDYILSAPIVAAGVDSGSGIMTTRSVILPPGKWIGWWDGSVNDGGKNGATISVTADLDTLPLYIAQGGIVPMLRDTIDTLSPVAAGSTVDSFDANAGVLWVRVAPSSTKSSFTVYDGATITQQSNGGMLTLTFQQGATPVFIQGALFEVIATAGPTSVMKGSAALASAASLSDLQGMSEGWFAEPATGGTVWIKVAGSATVTVH
jgi:alpha-D-xyloside xylohydrolase